jgi:SAM-dependent methyltransferase
MDLALLGEHWNRFGESDPMWSILMEPERQHGRWDKREFFERGWHDTEFAIKTVRNIEFPLRQGTALEFGCGLGRMTQGLACYFDEVHGVDIAASMIEQARRYNPYEDRLRFHVNQRDDLSLFKDNQFDFILSLIVLQHIRADYVKRYIAEFLRILAPGGLLLFQHPSHDSKADLSLTYEEWPLQFRRDVRLWMRSTARRLRGKAVEFAARRYGQAKYRRREPILDWEPTACDSESSRQSGVSEGTDSSIALAEPPRCEHHPIERRDILRHVIRHGGRIVDELQRADCGPDWVSYRYFVTK